MRNNMASRKTLVIHKTDPPPGKTHIIEIRVAFKGHTDLEECRVLEDALDLLRTIGAAEVIRRGVIRKDFDDWTIGDLRNAVWED